MAKTTPYPPCTVTALWLKYRDRDRMLRRVTQPPHIAGPLCVMQSLLQILNHLLVTLQFFRKFEHGKKIAIY
jgi:hypothetical protein